MNIKAHISPLPTLFILISSLNASDMLFSTERDRVTKAIRCNQPKITPASSGFGALYGCIAGNAETVKLFVNQIEGKDQVASIKLIWNDWTYDIGYGLHSDKKEAKEYVSAFSKLYASNLEKQILSAFFLNANRTFTSGDFRIAFTYSKGPKIDERMIVLTPLTGLGAKETSVKVHVNDFEACRQAVSKAANYSITNLIGDGHPTNESGYKSFMIRGKGKDLFFCEVYAGGRYKVKAALNGNYPFQYIAEGKF